jgi:hypothetical protein
MEADLLNQASVSYSLCYLSGRRVGVFALYLQESLVEIGFTV